MKRVLGAFGAAILLSLSVVQASAQQQGGSQLAGRWHCNMGIQGQPQKRLVSVVMRYVVDLYRNGAFAAQGVTQSAASNERFQARGRWGVQRRQQRYFLAMQGRKVSVGRFGRRDGTFNQWVQVYDLNNMGYRGKLQNGSNIAISCRRG